MLLSAHLAQGRPSSPKEQHDFNKIHSKLNEAPGDKKRVAALAQIARVLLLLSMINISLILIIFHPPQKMRNRENLNRITVIINKFYYNDNDDDNGNGSINARMKLSVL